jgi:hypothetical protein
MEINRSYTAFAGHQLIESGGLEKVILRTKACLDGGESRAVLVFEDQTGAQIDFDFRGSPDEVLAKLAYHPRFTRSGAPGEAQADAAGKAPGPARTGPGRPKLGVVCREVSLLPRHWSWLDRQPGGVSVAMRKLVEEARKSGQGEERARTAWEAAGKFMWVMAGNFPGFEEASRALYARDESRFVRLIRDWPGDVRTHVERLVGEAARLGREARDEVRGSSVPPA